MRSLSSAIVLLAALGVSSPGWAAGATSLGKKKPPPAELVVPERLREARARGDQGDGPAPLFALGAPDVLEALGPWAPVVGHWVEYYIEQPDELPQRVRLSVLAERPGGRFWIEVVAASPVGVPMASRLLVHGHPARAADVERLQIYIASQAVLELPLEDATESIDPSPASAAGVQVEKLAPQEVTVKAGRFQTSRLRIRRGKGKEAEQVTLYRASEVPIFHLVRSESSGSKAAAKGKPAQKPTVVELSASGKTGAHSIFPASAPLLEDAPAPAAPAPAP